MLNAVISKLISESLLSLYPVFVKKINLSIDLQLWTRLITYVMISLFFISYSFVTKNILTIESIGLSLINLIHIYTSYQGFNNLDSGVSFAIFNAYPLLILLFSGVLWQPAYLLAILGLCCFVYSNFNKERKNYTELVYNSFYFGLIMIIFATITEALMYFMVRTLKTDNNWNHLFISYFFGSIFMTIYLFGFETNTILEKTDWYTVGLAILINGIIGAIGYYLRFYSAFRLDPKTYSLLSFFGIIMAWIYGIVFNNEKLGFYNLLGTILIIMSNFFTSNII